MTGLVSEQKSLHSISKIGKFDQMDLDWCISNQASPINSQICPNFFTSEENQMMMGACSRRELKKNKKKLVYYCLCECFIFKMNLTDCHTRELTTLSYLYILAEVVHLWGFGSLTVVAVTAVDKFLFCSRGYVVLVVLFWLIQREAVFNIISIISVLFICTINGSNGVFFPS